MPSVEVVPAGTLELLTYFHDRLGAHFRQLGDQRAKLDPVAPVFALEHGLSEAERDLLAAAVRDAVARGFGTAYRRQWLTLVVYGSEIGYGYVGEEYWPSFVAATPGWDTNRRREHFKSVFKRFATDYGGARPTGVWADFFKVIAWPITHAVLPIYLQRYLAQLLYDYRNYLTTDLLHDPATLGARLASRAFGYTDRFRKFCENRALLGQVAAALLLGDDEGDSPYLLAPTFHRIVEGLEAEQQSMIWLRDARRVAHRVHASGFRPKRPGTANPRERADRAVTDPRFVLCRESGGWAAYALLPDLSVLQDRLPQLYDELNSLRAILNGRDRKLATGQLTYPGQEVRLDRWPAFGTPFIQLDRGSSGANAMLAAQVVVSPGPWWLFRIRPGAPAVYVKGTVLRAGSSYCVVCRTGTTLPNLPWMRPVPIVVEGAEALEFTVPETLTDSDLAVLRTVGLPTIADVEVRPVGLPAAAWDGEGTAEWLVGEPAMLAVRAERVPDRCVLTVAERPYVLPWPEDSPELFIGLEEMAAGAYDITVDVLAAEGHAPLAAGSLMIVVREPQVRPEGAARGEGIRLLASPARPSLTEFWDGRASITVEGPSDVQADLLVVLRDADRKELKQAPCQLTLPVRPADWGGIAARLRLELQTDYDLAESAELTVSRAGVGFASLTCDRGFQPLRWVLTKRDRTLVARLIDRTDGDETHVDYYSVAGPTVARPLHGAEFDVPAHGGMVRAQAGASVAALILPPDRNAFINGAVDPQVAPVPRTIDNVTQLIYQHAAWAVAELPADPFARYQRARVLAVIVSRLVSVISGAKWSQFEYRLRRPGATPDVDEMQGLVGDTFLQRQLAAEISANLYAWNTQRALAEGFGAVIAPGLSDAHLASRPEVPGFLLRLASEPGRLATWDPTDRDVLIERVLRSPVLIRAARYAVLGAAEIHSELDAADRWQEA